MDRVEDIAGRFTNLESRFDRAEANNSARFQHMEARFDARFDHLEREFDGRVDALDAKMTSCFTWMVGLTLASWLTLMYQFSRVR
ncbi:MAG TPA: hypothetical protein VN915_10735 [Elusimicrobiota bacterium]|nr:hypothetical protein [Elusimicrobiota bacterium]